MNAFSALLFRLQLGFIHSISSSCDCSCSKLIVLHSIQFAFGLFDVRAVSACLAFASCSCFLGFSTVKICSVAFPSLRKQDLQLQSTRRVRQVVAALECFLFCMSGMSLFVVMLLILVLSEWQPIESHTFLLFSPFVILLFLSLSSLQ